MFLARGLKDFKKGIRSPVGRGLLAFAVSLGVAAYIIALSYSVERETLERETVEAGALIRATIEKNIHRYLGALQLSHVALGINPDMGNAELQQMGRSLKSFLPAIMEIQLAPKGIVTHIFPEERADKVRGLNLFELPEEQKKALYATIESKDMLIAGPVNLVQGGTGLIARNPVTLEAASGEAKFWGFVTEIIDAEGFFAETLNEENFKRLAIAIRGRDSQGSAGDVFWGDASLFSLEDVATTDVLLPGQGSWQIAVRLPSEMRHRYVGINLLRLMVVLAASLIIGRLVTQHHQQQLELKEKATTDSLTGALMREEFFIRAKRGWARAQRAGQPCSIATLDIDHFKRINDSYGHPAGDQVLVEVIRRVKAMLRTGDEIGRIGGEEFAILAFGCDAAGASLLAERIREGINASPVKAFSKPLTVTASFGIAEFHRHGDDIPTLMAMADRALYRAKAEGRNRTVIAEEETELVQA